MVTWVLIDRIVVVGDHHCDQKAAAELGDSEEKQSDGVGGQEVELCEDPRPMKSDSDLKHQLIGRGLPCRIEFRLGNERIMLAISHALLALTL